MINQSSHIVYGVSRAVLKERVKDTNREIGEMQRQRAERKRKLRRLLHILRGYEAWREEAGRPICYVSRLGENGEAGAKVSVAPS